VQKDANRGCDSDGHWEWSVVSSRLHVSPRWAALVGADEREVGTTPDSWLTKIHPDDRDRVSAGLQAHMAPDGPNDFDLPHRLRHADGSYRWMSCRGTVQRDAGGKAVRLVGAHADVTADTVIDPVTGLPNRLLLLEHLTRSIERAKRYAGFHFALLVVDLDLADLPTGTPEVVDDPLLVAAARRLETCLRLGDAASGFRHDDIVARLEGDTFAILVDGLREVGDATTVADRMLATLVRPFTTRNHDVFLSPSLGVAVSATGYATADAALRDAETALHRAKLLGKARYEFFDTAILKTAQVELQLEADFAGALDRHEFKVFYQPIVALDSHAIVGFEALARWQHPVLGMVSPLDFIPLAEKTGFILPLGLWMLRQACQQLKTWQQLPSVRADLWVSVNVSALQFAHEPLYAEIKQVVTDTGLEPSHLVLELTEASAADRPTAVKAVLMQLRSLGIRISVDDFGTGHSSLTRLRQFPIDCLKVDRALIRGMETSSEMTAILGSITDMARQLALQVVVEGVENGAQLALLQSVHCEYVQGFVFSKPLDGARATALLEQGTSLAPAVDMGPAMADVPLAAASTVTRGRWPNPRYIAATALLSVAAVTAAVLVLRDVIDGSFDGGAVSAPAAASLGVSTPAGATSGATAEPANTPAPATPRAVTAAPLSVAATTTAKVISAGEANTSFPASGDTAARATVGRQTLSRPGASEANPARVVHQHRLGSCRGVLTASTQGLQFEPEGPASKDAFTFGYGNFVHGLDGETLVVKTSDRTFRFRSVNTNGASDSGLTALLASLKSQR
jgi:diguanylate cyclase (GGDEF)-like protein